MVRSKIGKSPFKLIPPGIYTARLVEAKIDTIGPLRGLHLTFEIINGPQKGRKIFKTIPANDRTSAQIEIAQSTDHGRVMSFLPRFSYGSDT